MTVRQPRYSKEDATNRGDEIYDRDIRDKVEPGHNGEIVALDLDTGAWEMDIDEDVASDRLQARLPDAQIMVIRVGLRYVRRFGAGRRIEFSSARSRFVGDRARRQWRTPIPLPSRAYALT